jgi:hypothetical protein
LLKSKVTSSTTKEALPTPIQKRQSWFSFAHHIAGG